MSDDLGSGLRGAVRLAVANVSWRDAVDPHQSEMLRASFGGIDAANYEGVKARFGTNAARAWQDGVNARERYFEAVSKAPVLDED